MHKKAACWDALIGKRNGKVASGFFFMFVRGPEFARHTLAGIAIHLKFVRFKLHMLVCMCYVV